MYKDIKSPKELLEFISKHINYGFVDDDNKIYDCNNIDEFENGCKTKWKLSSPKRLIDVGYGHCFDQVELERNWFINNGYEVKTFYIWFELPYDNEYTTHTYLVYKDREKYYYFEHSDSNNRGIYEFNSYEDAVRYQKNKHIEYNKIFNKVGEKELKSIAIYEYEKPKYGLSFNEFIENILDNGKIIEV